MRGSELEGGQRRKKRGSVVLAVVLAVTSPDKSCRELLIVRVVYLIPYLLGTEVVRSVYTSLGQVPRCRTTSPPTRVAAFPSVSSHLTSPHLPKLQCPAFLRHLHTTFNPQPRTHVPFTIAIRYKQLRACPPREMVLQPYPYTRRRTRAHLATSSGPSLFCVHRAQTWYLEAFQLSFRSVSTQEVL